MEGEKERELRISRWQAWIEGVRSEAEEAWRSERHFHVIHLDHGGSVAGWVTHRDTEADDVPGALQVIESVGWKLATAGYVYQPLKERSHVLTDSAKLTGSIIGVYTFRRPAPEPA